MSKASLAKLDQAVDASIALELGESNDEVDLEELGVAPRRFRVVNGFRLVSNAARDAEMDSEAGSRMDRLMRFRADKHLVLQKLRCIGVTPLAVLPFPAWTQICQNTGLYRFAPKGNQVRIDYHKLMKSAEAAAREVCRAGAWSTTKKVWWLTGIAYATILLAMFLLGKATLTSFGFLTVIAVMVALFALAGPEGPSYQHEVVKTVKEVIIANHANSLLHELLWPDFVEPAPATDRTSDVMATITLPDPPTEVQDVLVRLERSRLPVSIAAVREAIGIHNLKDTILSAERATWEELSRDPIIYVCEGSAVAILAQYGDFEIEQQVISDVVNSIHLV